MFYYQLMDHLSIIYIPKEILEGIFFGNLIKRESYPLKYYKNHKLNSNIHFLFYASLCYSFNLMA